MNGGFPWKKSMVPSGKHTKNYGKSPFFHGKFHYKWWDIPMVNPLTYVVGGLEHLDNFSIYWE